MARTVSIIQAQIKAQVDANPTLVLLVPNASQTAIFKVWIYIQAVTIAVFEQLQDVYKSEIETAIKSAPVGSDFWLQKKVLEFQYDAITPQVVQLDTVTMAVGYDPIDVTKRIVTRASVKTTGARVVTVKVAKNEPPVALTAPELASLQGYLTNGGDGTFNGRGVGIGFAGTQIVATSTASDKVYIKGTINYDGQYAATISATVITAIKDYLSNIPFDGEIKIISLIDYIQNVPGVVDVLFEDVAIRADATAFINKTYLIQTFTEIISKYPTFAGYAVEETTPGEDFVSRLTFTAI
jgi:uncharacterized phage protein gp47/JayE